MKLGLAMRVVLALLLGAGVLAGRAQAAPPAGPAIEPAREGTRCVAEPALMRREHMRMLRHQRDDTVRAGLRGSRAPHGLRGCIDCHAGAATHSVASAPGDFCVSCHRYAAVRIDCFDCHNPRSDAPTAAGRVAGTGAAP